MSQTFVLCRKQAKEEAIDSLPLCPGFTHTDVAEIFEALGGEVGVSVARSDGPSSRIAAAARRRAGYGGDQRPPPTVPCKFSACVATGTRNGALDVPSKREDRAQRRLKRA